MSSRVLAVACVGLSFAMPAFAVDFDVSGACPGIVNLEATNGTPNGNHVFVTGTLGGSTVMAGGPCVGGTLDLGAPLKVRFNGAANANGEITLSPNVGANACATGGQWLDLTTCTTSEAKSLTPTCAVPDVTNGDVGPVAGPPFMTDPNAFTNWIWNSVDGGVRENFTIDDPMAPVTLPASLIIDFYDDLVNQTYICSAWFDIDAAVPSVGYTSVTRDPMTLAPTATATPPPFDAVELTLTEGFTDCGPLDPAGLLGMALGGTSDIRAFAQNVVLTTAYNAPSADMEDFWVTTVGLGQMAWDTDFAPFVNSTSFFGVETNLVDTYDRTCDLVDPVAPIAAPAGPMTEHEFDFPFIIFQIL
jgi:hypothetical protein